MIRVSLDDTNISLVRILSEVVAALSEMVEQREKADRDRLCVHLMVKQWIEDTTENVRDMRAMLKSYRDWMGLRGEAGAISEVWDER